MQVWLAQGSQLGAPVLGPGIILGQAPAATFKDMEQHLHGGLVAAFACLGEPVGTGEDILVDALATTVKHADKVLCLVVTLQRLWLCHVESGTEILLGAAGIFLEADALVKKYAKRSVGARITIFGALIPDHDSLAVPANGSVMAGRNTKTTLIYATKTDHGTWFPLLSQWLKKGQGLLVLAGIERLLGFTQGVCKYTTER